MKGLKHRLMAICDMWTGHLDGYRVPDVLREDVENMRVELKSMAESIASDGDGGEKTDRQLLIEMHEKTAALHAGLTQ